MREVVTSQKIRGSLRSPGTRTLTGALFGLPWSDGAMSVARRCRRSAAVAASRLSRRPPLHDFAQSSRQGFKKPSHADHRQAINDRRRGSRGSTSRVTQQASRSKSKNCHHPTKPTNNAFVESLNGKVRAKCIDQNRFLSLDDTRSKCESYRREYNEERPRSAIGNKSPVEFIKPSGNPAVPWSKEREIRPQAGPTLGASSAAPNSNLSAGPIIGGRPTIRGGRFTSISG